MWQWDGTGQEMSGLENNEATHRNKKETDHCKPGEEKTHISLNAQRTIT